MQQKKCCSCTVCFSLPESQRQQGMTHTEPENEGQEDREIDWQADKTIEVHKREKECYNSERS